MFRLLFQLVIWLGLPGIAKRWRDTDCTWTISNGEYKDHLPWKFGSNIITTTYGNNKQGFHQQYGSFRATFHMQEAWCFWLLQLQHEQYLEIDHFETFPDSISLTSWRNRHFNSQRRVPNRTYMNPGFQGHLYMMRNIYSRVKIRNKKVREFILTKPHRYDIIWRKWFVLWKVDGWPCGIVFRNIPRQPMFLIVTGPDAGNIIELQAKL